MKRKDLIIGYSLIILAVFTWSIVEIIIKLVQEDIGPVSLSFFRYFIGGVFLLFILALKKDFRGIKKMTQENWKLFIIISAFTQAFSNILYFMGVGFTQANIASAILTTYPIWITIFSFLILQERSNLKFKILGIVLGLFGVVILITGLDFTGFIKDDFLWGNLLVLSGSIIWGLYTPLGKKIQIKERENSNNALKFTTMSFLFAGMVILIILPFTNETTTFFRYDLDIWIWISFLGIVSTGFGQYIFFLGIEHIEVSKGISFAFLKPIFATILAFFFLNELPNVLLIVSICLVALSIIFINKPNSNLEKEIH